MSAEKIGNETIYPVQSEMAQEVIDIFKNNENPDVRHPRTPVVITEPQFGKTGIMIDIISKFILWQEEENSTFQQIIACGLTDNSLLSQTRCRLTRGVSTNKDDFGKRVGAQLHVLAQRNNLDMFDDELGIRICHNSSGVNGLGNENNNSGVYGIPREGVNRRLWVIDECHMGNGKFGTIDKALKYHGVDLSEQMFRWNSPYGTKDHVVCVSATPFAHQALDSYFSIVSPKKLPETYNSISYMFSVCRVRQTENLFIGKTEFPTRFLTNILREFKNNCDTNGAGYLVIRAQGETKFRLESYLNASGMFERTTILVNSDKGNIKSLNKLLATQPREPVVVIISGAMRAGVSLEKNNYIRGWVEQSSLKADTCWQSGLGRACGHNKKHQTYPIYCNLTRAKEALSYYEGVYSKKKVSLPSGIQNTKTKGTKTINYKPVVISESEYKEELAMLDDTYYATQKLSSYRKEGSVTKRDGAASFMNGTVLSEMGKKLHYLHLDAAQFGYEETWKELNVKYPQFAGKIVKIVREDSEWESLEDTSDCVKKSCALSSRLAV